MVQFEHRGRRPSVNGEAWVAPSAVLVGDVNVASGSSVWFGAVLRADGAPIRVGNDSNVQDGAVLHPDRSAAYIGSRVTIGHGAVLEGVYVEDEVLIGIGALVLEDTRVGRGSLVAAGAVVPSGMDIPAGSLLMGNPARIVGSVEPRHQRLIQEAWRHYRELMESYRRLAPPTG